MIFVKREREREHDVITADNFFNKERKNERINVREVKSKRKEERKEICRTDSNS